MKPHIIMLLGACVALGACGPSTSTGPSPSSSRSLPSSSPSSATFSAGSAPASSSSSAGAQTEAASAVVSYQVSYNWGVPSTTVEIKHTTTPPIAPPPAPPLPYLVGIYAADHPEGAPAYQRISFYFRGAFPGYRFSYVPSVLSDGRGEPIPLQGNAFLRLAFVGAQAHGDSGSSTITASPPSSLGYSALKSYGFGGDFEGYVTYGLGIQVAPNSDQARQIRTGELKKSDGSSGYFYVVHVDVRS
jgi:hypothetical protein